MRSSVKGLKKQNRELWRGISIVLLFCSPLWEAEELGEECAIIKQPSMGVVPSNTCKHLIRLCRLSFQGLGEGSCHPRWLLAYCSIPDSHTSLNTVTKPAWLPHSPECAVTAVEELTLVAIYHEGFV
ncbi:UNVERIFIED_CONTAM: hypothetical protein K2H54_062622 [Gekko kuhli]